jgi:lysozyme
MHQNYLQAIKSFEGYTPQAQWDYAQFSSGYGTKALYAGEQITPEEAEKRFAAEIAAARSIVEKHAPSLDEGTKAALTSLTFNAGSRWINSGLGDAVRRQDMDAVKERFLQYTKAGGEVLPGLVKRRLAEMQWIGQPENVAAAIPGATSATASVQQPAPGSTVQATRAEPTPFLQQAALMSPEPTAGVADSIESRDAQALSMLVTLLLDLQMRSAQADPMNPTENRSDRSDRGERSI